VLPEIENPIPEKIGLDTVVAFAGAIAMFSLAVSTLLGRSGTQREKWLAWGTVLGLASGVFFYAVALLAQLLCRQ
jgi:NADH:ubiquinone oxidoreductase subunit 6 (subunit J)